MKEPCHRNRLGIRGLLKVARCRSILFLPPEYMGMFQVIDAVTGEFIRCVGGKSDADEVDTGEEDQAIGHTSRITCVRFHPEQKYICASGGWDRSGIFINYHMFYNGDRERSLTGRNCANGAQLPFVLSYTVAYTVVLTPPFDPDQFTCGTSDGRVSPPLGPSKGQRSMEMEWTYLGTSVLLPPSLQTEHYRYSLP